MKQIVGWILLGLGVSIIIWGLMSSYQYFTGKKAAPEIFKSQQIETQKEAAEGGGKKQLSPQEQAQQEMQKAITEQIGQMLPADFLPKVLNLGIWLMFVWVLIMAGGKISGIGIQLLKADKVDKTQ